MMLCACSIPNGLSPMAIVLRVSLTNHASQNYSVFLHARTFGPENRRAIMRYQSDHGFRVTGRLKTS
jgi:hypothetical protein